MAEKWKPLGKKWTLAEMQKLSPFAVYRMPLAEKAELAQAYYRQFKLRETSYVNALTIPFAYSKLVKDFAEPAHPERMTADQLKMTLEEPVVKTSGRNRTLSGVFATMDNPSIALNHYVTRMQAFFGAKSSTVSGWKEIGLAQDISLFGVNAEQYTKYSYVKDESGKRKRKELFGPFFKVTPRYTMSDAERIKFWSIVDLAKESGWLNRFGYSSSQAHRQIASLWMNGTLVHDDIDEAYNTILDILDDKRRMRGAYPDTTELDSPFVQKEGGGNIDERSDRSDLLTQYDTLLQ